MKGLLLKDYYMLLKQVKLYLIFIVILSIIPNMNLSSIATVYAAMLPITLIAFDERSKWDQLAFMMPYTKRELVLSKYLIGYIAIVICCLLSLALQAIVGMVTRQGFSTEQLFNVVLTAVVGLILIAINLPFMFWLGVERGRIVFMVLIAFTVFVGMMSADSAKQMLATRTISPGLLFAVCAGVAVVLSLASIAASNKLYRRKYS